MPAEKEAAGIPAKGNWESRSDANFLFYRAGAKPPKETATEE
jgi:hypothetical protein